MDQIPYRLFFFDENDHIRARRVLEATDDEGAVVEAGRYPEGTYAEIWCGTRFIGRLPPG